MHCHLESSMMDVSAEADLPGAFRERWINSQPFDFSVKALFVLKVRHVLTCMFVNLCSLKTTQSNPASNLI